MLGRPSRKRRQDLDTRGQSAVAVVLEVGKHGLSISSGNETSWNNEVSVKARIRVEPAGEPSFEWDGKLRFWESQKPVADDRIWVLFDPEDHENLTVDFSEHRGALGGHFSPQANADTAAGMTWATGSAPSGSEPADALRRNLGDHATIVGGDGPSATPSAPDPLAGLERLADLRDRGVLTADEFETQKRRLLGEQPTP